MQIPPTAIGSLRPNLSAKMGLSKQVSPRHPPELSRQCGGSDERKWEARNAANLIDCIQETEPGACWVVEVRLPGVHHLGGIEHRAARRLPQDSYRKTGSPVHLIPIVSCRRRVDAQDKAPEIQNDHISLPPPRNTLQTRRPPRRKLPPSLQPRLPNVERRHVGYQGDGPRGFKGDFDWLRSSWLIGGNNARRSLMSSLRGQERTRAERKSREHPGPRESYIFKGLGSSLMITRA